MQSSIANLKDLNLPVKVLFTGYLCAVGIGYFFALIQVLFTHGMADGKFGLSVEDIVYSYYGNRSGSVMETKLNGSMKDNATEQQRFDIMQWVRDGADIKEYKANGVNKIIEERCLMCHNADSSTLPDFADFEQLKALTEQDTGATFGSLTRISHIHLFGISFIFMFVGIIFNFAETTSNFYKCIAVGMPYVFLISDILSWWLTKLHPLFAWLVMLAGSGMAVSFAFMWLISILEMWFFNKAFVNSVGERYILWSVFVEQKLEQMGCKNASTVFNKLFCFAKRVSLFVWEKWLETGLPFVKKLVENKS